jgi:hypothetical protein
MGFRQGKAFGKLVFRCTSVVEWAEVPARLAVSVVSGEGVVDVPEPTDCRNSDTDPLLLRSCNMPVTASSGAVLNSSRVR